jgi:hypothetical protein
MNIFSGHTSKTFFQEILLSYRHHNKFMMFDMAGKGAVGKGAINRPWRAPASTISIARFSGFEGVVSLD